MRIYNRYSVSLLAVLAVVAFTSASVAQQRSPSNRALGQRPVRSANLPNRPQSPAPAAPANSGSRIAVIDISYVFKNHNRFKQSMEDMKTDVEAFEAHLKQSGAQMQKLQTQLREYAPGTPDYKRVQEQIAQFQARVQADTQLKRTEFLQREAKIYYNVYKEIVDEVNYFAQSHGIELVVRFNSEPIDPENRKSVLEGVNRTVVFQRHLNITFNILERLNGPAPQSPPDGMTRNTQIPVGGRR